MKLRPPEQIYLRPFDTSSGRWEGRTRTQAGRLEVRDWLMASLEQRLAEIAPTAPVGDEPPASGWLVTGRFMHVNPGSKLQRMFIGFAAGGSKLETKVSVYDLRAPSAPPLITFTTTGGTNRQTGPQALLINATENDIERTAREVRDFLRARLWAAGDDPGVHPATTKFEPVEIDRANAGDSIATPGGRQRPGRR